ncbi:MAG: head GIN domain-containing protein [Bacteroidota bacterium]
MALRIFLFYILSFYCISVFSQERVETISETFNKVKISSGIIAEVYPNSTENKVVISGVDRDEINVRIRRDELRISLPLNHLFSNSDTDIKIYVSGVETFEATSSAELKLMNKIEQNTLHFKAVESAIIYGEIEVEKLHIQVQTNGGIQLKGRSATQDVLIKTGGEYDGEHLKTNSTTVEISYGGEAKVRAKQECFAKITAGGEISVYGNPKTLEENTKLGGMVKKVVVNK